MSTTFFSHLIYFLLYVMGGQLFFFLFNSTLKFIRMNFLFTHIKSIVTFKTNDNNKMTKL